MPPATFPVMRPWSWRDAGHRVDPRDGLETVPWSFVATHRARAWTNHMQSLERLAERGGLCPDEILALLADRPLRFGMQEDQRACVKRLRQYLAAFEQRSLSH